MKKSILLMGAMTLAASLPLTAFAAVPIKVELNGTQFSFPDDQPYIDQNSQRTMVPVRFISHGEKVDWNANSGVVSISTGDSPTPIPVTPKPAPKPGAPVVGQNGVVQVLGHVGVKSPSAFLLRGEPITQSAPSPQELNQVYNRLQKQFQSLTTK